MQPMQAAESSGVFGPPLAVPQIRGGKRAVLQDTGGGRGGCPTRISGLQGLWHSLAGNSDHLDQGP
eukprot:5509463-Alexandrium_andersonii.AAC.1